MGCDYFIDKDLYIYYKNNKVTFINIDHEKGYFYEIDIDVDEEQYDKKYDECIREQLKPRMKPIIIYKNNNFINSNLETKYKKLIEDSINNKILNKNIWEDIIKIVKKESRYERD